MFFAGQVISSGESSLYYMLLVVVYLAVAWTPRPWSTWLLQEASQAWSLLKFDSAYLHHSYSCRQSQMILFWTVFVYNCTSLQIRLAMYIHMKLFSISWNWIKWTEHLGLPTMPNAPLVFSGLELCQQTVTLCFAAIPEKLNLMSWIQQHSSERVRFVTEWIAAKGPSPVQEHTAEVAELLQESPRQCEWIVWPTLKENKGCFECTCAGSADMSGPSRNFDGIWGGNNP